MSNVPLMFQPLIKYADFNGRSRRSEFWLWVLFRILLGSALSAIFSSVMMSHMMPIFTNPNASPQQFFQQMGSIMTISPWISLINLGLLVPSIAVGVRRLHDIGRSGWWIIMPVVVAIVCVILMMIFGGAQIFAIAGHGDHMSDAEGAKFALGLVGTIMLCMIPILIAEIVMLVFYVTEGQRRENRFGPDPKGPALNDTP